MTADTFRMIGPVETVEHFVSEHLDICTELATLPCQECERYALYWADPFDMVLSLDGQAKEEAFLLALDNESPARSLMCRCEACGWMGGIHFSAP